MGLPVQLDMLENKPTSELTVEERKKGEWIIAGLDILLMRATNALEDTDPVTVFIAAREIEKEGCALRDEVQKYGREVAMCSAYHIGITKALKVMDRVDDLDKLVKRLKREAKEARDAQEAQQSTASVFPEDAEEKCLVCTTSIPFGQVYCDWCFGNDVELQKSIKAAKDAEDTNGRMSPENDEDECTVCALEITAEDRQLYGHRITQCGDCLRSLGTAPLGVEGYISAASAMFPG